MWSRAATSLSVEESDWKSCALREREREEYFLEDAPARIGNDEGGSDEVDEKEVRVEHDVGLVEKQIAIEEDGFLDGQQRRADRAAQSRGAKQHAGRRGKPVDDLEFLQIADRFDHDATQFGFAHAQTQHGDVQIAHHVVQRRYHAQRDGLQQHAVDAALIAGESRLHRRDRRVHQRNRELESVLRFDHEHFPGTSPARSPRHLLVFARREVAHAAFQPIQNHHFHREIHADGQRGGGDDDAHNAAPHGAVEHLALIDGESRVVVANPAEQGLAEQGLGRVKLLHFLDSTGRERCT